MLDGFQPDLDVPSTGRDGKRVLVISVADAHPPAVHRDDTFIDWFSVDERTPVDGHGHLGIRHFVVVVQRVENLVVDVLRVANEHGHCLILASPRDDRVGFYLDYVGLGVADEQDAPTERPS
jgi:hypothetical protein